MSCQLSPTRRLVVSESHERLWSPSQPLACTPSSHPQTPHTPPKSSSILTLANGDSAEALTPLIARKRWLSLSLGALCRSCRFFCQRRPCFHGHQVDTRFASLILREGGTSRGGRGGELSRTRTFRSNSFDGAHFSFRLLERRRKKKTIKHHTSRK